MPRFRARPTVRSPRRCAWLFAVLCIPLAALAQSPAPGPLKSPVAVAPAVPVPRTTGDATLDMRLLDIDRYGARYRDAFVDELVRYHAAPRDLVLALLERGWPPGDVYYACALAQATGRACRHVADGVADGAPPDWVAIAQRLGAAPGSPRLARVRDGVEATYRRWGRPLPAAAGTASGSAGARASTGTRAPDAPPRPPAAAARKSRESTASQD